VQVLFNHKLDSEEEAKAIAEDKFLVQLAPLQEGVDLKNVQGEKNIVAELNKLFSLVSKTNMVQFKLKV